MPGKQDAFYYQPKCIPGGFSTLPVFDEFKVHSGAIDIGVATVQEDIGPFITSVNKLSVGRGKNSSISTPRIKKLQKAP
jgi:hypothetical protein